MDDADDLDHNVAVSGLEPINTAVAELLPGLVPTSVRAAASMDAYSTDGHARVDQMPGIGNVWLLGGFSGHGFNMAPALGQVAAELAVQGKTSLLVDHLNPARFLT
jgi:sarcosine oxidase